MRWNQVFLTGARLLLMLFLVFCSGSGLTAQIVTGEYFFDVDPGAGQGVTFSVPKEDILDDEFLFDTDGLEPGEHRLGVRFKNEEYWGVTEVITFHVEPDVIPQEDIRIIKGEYYINSYPGTGSAIPFEITATEWLDDEFELELPELSAGAHFLGLRIRDDNGQWSIPKILEFDVVAEESNSIYNIERFKYIINDENDDQVKTGILTIDDLQPVVDDEFKIDTEGLVPGLYTVYVTPVSAVDLNGGTESLSFVIYDGNSPETIALSNSEVEEDQPIGTVVGSFSTEDIDEDETHTYTLVTGDGDEDNAAFTIEGDQLKTAAIFDFATKSSYSIRVRSTDLGELFTDQTFTVTVIDAKEDQTITFTEIGIDTYGDTETLVATASSGLDVTFESSDPTIATVTGNELKFIGVGEVIISAIQVGDDTYGAEEATQTIQVSKASLIVTADYKTKVYGADNPELTTTYSGFVNEDDINSLTQLPEIATSALASSDAGDYDITLSGGESDNYAFSFTNGVLTVTKAVLSVVADAKSRVYGEDNPELTLVYTGFVNGDSESDLDTAPILSTTAASSSDVGVYPIALTGGEDGNYAFDLMGAELAIIKAVLIVEAENATRNKGEDNPEFSITYSGFVNGDGVNDLDGLPTASTSATSESERGTYDIVPSGGSDNNYSFDFRNGTLTVTGPVFTLPTSIEFGQVNSGESATASTVIENTGDGLLQVSAISLPPGFSADQNTFDLAVSESISLTLTFSPTEGKMYSGNLVVSSNDGTSMIALAGEGVLVTGLDDEVLDAEEVKTYPNPATNELTIDLSAGPVGPVNLSLTDPKGQERLSLKDVRERKVTLDISSYRMGIYILKIESRKGTVFKKVMIER